MTIDTKRAVTQSIGWLAIGVNLAAAAVAIGLGFTLQAATHLLVAIAVSANQWILDHAHAWCSVRQRKAEAACRIAELAASQWERHTEAGRVPPDLARDVRRRAN